jgi:hypothetical protein
MCGKLTITINNHKGYFCKETSYYDSQFDYIH